MSSTTRIFKRHKKAKDLLSDLYDSPNYILIIHYSCESFYDIKEGRSPRITSIAVRYLRSAQTKSFSIHKVAEVERVGFTEIENRYDELEKKMLTDFFSFAREHKDYKWLHWNMRDINYGFEAIENRLTVLGVEPFHLDDNKKIDLARELINKYGAHYIGHPRLTKLLEKNSVATLDLLSGAEEAKAFEQKEYVKLHQSTLRKVDVMESILKRTVEETIKVNSKWFQMYGLTPQGIYEAFKENWFASLILTIVGILIGWLLPKFLDVVFF